MNDYRRMAYCIIVLLVCAASDSGADTEIEPLEGENLALGKTAMFSLEPNYSLCAGGDDTDLFDGAFWQPGDSGFWTDKGTVGWQFGRKPGVLISFDLGGIYPIDTIGFDTTSGAAQVTFPAALLVYVSDDGEGWHYVGDLINEAIPQDRYVRHRFIARGLKIRGRHLAIYVAKGGFYGFVDEIEVMAGADESSAISFEGAGIARAELENDALGRVENAVEKNIGLYFVQAARDQVMSMAGGDTAAVLRQLDALEAEVYSSTGSAVVDYSAGMPYTEVDRRICAAMGAHFSSGAAPAAVLWQPTESMWSHRTNPFARPAKAVAPNLHADMMVGEYEPVAFNVSNNTAASMEIRVEVGALQGAGGEEVWPATQIEPYIATHVVGSGFLFFDDALKPLEDGGATVAPGMTRQVWLILHSRGVAPQQYAGKVAVTAGDAHFEVPLSAVVYPVEMPADPTYTAQSWGYFTWKPSKGFEQQAAAEQERCYANAHVLHHTYIPWPRVDKETGKLVRPVEVDFAKLDEMLDYRPYVRQWLLWTGFEFGYMDLNYQRASDIPEVGTPEHEALFKEWVRQIRDHMLARGFPTDKWAFYWVDEPGDAGFEKYIVPSSTFAKQVDPTILIWEDHQISLEMLEKYPDAIDIHCCPLKYYREHPEILEHVLAEEQAGVHYVVGSAKASDPHQYYRLHHMAAVELGLDGAGMWVWGDDGGQFNDYAGPYPSYGMVYATANGPISGKRREAWREGIEDVELWRHLGRVAQESGGADLVRLHREGPALLVSRKDGRVDLVQVDQHSGTPEQLMEMRLKVLQAVAAARKK